MKPTVVIMAANVASRYGSLKQIQFFGPFGRNNYGLFYLCDACRAGFAKVVFIIRKEFAEDFKAIFEPKLKGKIAVDYVFEDMQSFVEGFDIRQTDKYGERLMQFYVPPLRCMSPLL